MKLPTIAFVVMAVLICSGLGGHQNGSRIVLPNPELLGCSFSKCSQLWQERRYSKAIYPKQISMDIKGSCPLGIVARYDTSVSPEEIKAAVDQRYGRWAMRENEDANIPVKLWRVEPGKYAIQLAPIDQEMETMTLGQVLAQPLRQQEKKDGGKVVGEQIIYLAFAGTGCHE